jgi:hypothetical protein
MKTTKPATAPHPIHTVHRIGIGTLGGFLLLFGIEGLLARMPFTSVQGQMVMGLSTNGLLATISVATAVVLIAGAARGGHTASTVGIALGTLFLVSGVANVFFVGTAMNVFAFRLSNVIFSFVVGLALLFTGAYGRISSELPPDSPYFRPDRDAQARAVPDQRTPAERIADQACDHELAQAERAVALRHGTPEQLAGVQRAAAFRTAADRRRAFRSRLTSTRRSG